MSYKITERCNGCGACVRMCPASAISGEKKNPHQIDTNLCIECGVCGRICPRIALLDAEGDLCAMIKRSEWLKPVVVLKTCIACGICIDACPTGCLAMSERPRHKGVDAYPYMKDAKTCIGCELCCRECPMDAIVMRKPGKTQKAADSGESA